MTLSADGTLTANFVPVVIIYTPSISVSPTTIQAGGTFTATGSGFNPALPIDLRVTDLYGNLLAIYSKSPAANGTITFSNLVLPTNISYNGPGYVYGRQTDGSESNHFAVTIQGALFVQHRYYDRYVRIDSGALPAYVRVYIQDVDANVYISQDLLTLSTLGKRLCFKGSSDMYDSHHIRLSVKNEGTSTIGVTFGLAYNAGAANGNNNPALTAGSETARVDIGTWSIFSASDFDYAGCEGVGPPPPGSDCDSKFPNRQTNLWEMIGWGTCVGVNAVWGAIQPVFQPIFDTISKMLSPFLQPWLDFSTALTGFVTATSDWIKDPWTPLKTTYNELTAPLVDALGKIKLEVPDIGGMIWAQLQMSLHPIVEAMGAEVTTGSGEIWATHEKPRVGPETSVPWPWGGMVKAFRAITGDWDEMAKRWANIASEATTTGTETWHSDLSATLKPVGDKAVKDMLDAVDVSKYAHSPITPEEAVTAATAIAGGIVGTSIAIWLAHAAAEAASLGQYEAVKDLDTVVLSKLGLSALGARILSVPIERGLIVNSEYFYNSLFRPELLPLNVLETEYLRNEIDEEFHDLQLKYRGYTDEKIKKIKEAYTRRPSPAEYMSMRAEGTITAVDYHKRMAEHGFSEFWADKLYDEYLREPSMRELATLYRRGKISRDAFVNMYEVARLDRKYERLDSETGAAGTGSLDAWKELIYNDPSWRQLNVMATSGKLTDAQIDELLTAMGTRPEYMAVLTEVLKELPGTTQRRQVLTLEARLVALGRLDEATYNTDAVELKVAPQISEMILRVERTRLKTGAEAPIRQESLGNLNTWYMSDIIDADTYRSMAKDLTYPDDIIDNQLAYLDKKKAAVTPPPVTEREATRSMYDSYYMEDIIDAPGYRDALTALRYPESIIDLQLALLDKRKTPTVTPPSDLTTERDLLQSEALAAFKKRIIDEPTLRDRLDKLGRSSEAIDVLVAIAKSDMAVESRDATLAVYAKAYRQGAILRSDYLAKLIDNQYTPDAAELIVQTEELSWGTGVETLTQTQILNSWELGFIDDEQVQKRLKATGLADTDMHVLLSNSVLDQLKAKHITSAEADKKWSDLGVGPDERAKLLTWYGWTPT
jgi:hypothetical protein